MELRLEECFPDTIGGINFSHEKATSVNTFTVAVLNLGILGILGLNHHQIKNHLKVHYQDILKNSVVRQVQSQIPRVLRRLF